jgi:Uma2 family endonuclease
MRMLLTIPIPESQQRVHLPPGTLDWSEDEFFRFCQANPNLRIERTANREIIVMSPAGGYSSYQNLQVTRQLGAWAEMDKTGIAFDSSAGFRLPNGAMRSPDAAWVRLSRLQELTHREKEQFIPLCPDFVIEVASPSDEISGLREKMREYVQAGLRLGWLILPRSTQVEVYTPSDLHVLESPNTLSGDPVLPGFTLDLAFIWKPPF